MNLRSREPSGKLLACLHRYKAPTAQAGGTPYSRSSTSMIINQGFQKRYFRKSGLREGAKLQWKQFSLLGFGSMVLFRTYENDAITAKSKYTQLELCSGTSGASKPIKVSTGVETQVRHLVRILRDILVNRSQRRFSVII
jgi:hypothetical protein